MAIVVFDLGGVLIDWDPNYLFESLIPDRERRAFFLKRVCHSVWNARMDAGHSFEVEVRARQAEFPEWSAEIEAYWKQWPTMLGDAFEGTVALLDRVRARHRVFALTNWSAETFPVAVERFGFIEWFEGVLVSGEEQLAKPDPRIFQRFCTKFGLSPSSLLFIDDRPDNISAATREGWAGLVYTGPEQLERDLEHRGLL